MTTVKDPHTLAQKSLRGFFGNFPQVTALNTRLQALKDYTCAEEEPECLAITGETGTGKTRLLTTFSNRYPRSEHDDHSEIPVVYVKVPARCTIKRLAGLLLQAMGSAFWNCGDEEDRTHQLLTLLDGCNVRLIILDEVNHLADRGAAKTHYEIGDWIKQLSGESRKPIVLAGTPSASILWETNEQLADRYEVVSLEPLSMEPHRIRELRSVLKSFLRLMEGLNVVDLADEEYLRPMVFATGGRLRDIRMLLVRAVVIAQRNQSYDVVRTTLEQAFKEVIFPRAPDKRNPFHAKFDGLPLIGTNEPFARRRRGP